MKLKKIATTAFVGLVAISALTAGATSASAVATEIKSSGKVKVTEGPGTGGGPGNTTDPEKPDEKLPGVDPDSPDIDGNGTNGPLKMRGVSQLVFPDVETGSSEVNVAAKELSFDGGQKKRGALVEWHDIRSAGNGYGYTIKAKMTKQFTTGTGANEKILDGAKITYKNPHLEAEGGNLNLKPATVAGIVELKINQEVPVVTAAKATKEGKGTWVLEFGRSKDYTGSNGVADTAKDSVNLMIPSTTASNMDAGDYTAEIQWTISAIN